MVRGRFLVAIAVAVVACLLAGGPAQARRRKARARGASKPVPALTRDGKPNVMAAAAVVIDLDKGEELYAKHAADQRYIASVGKLFVALVVRDEKVPLDGKTTITEDDKKFARGGSRSRLAVGKTFTNHDLLRAMLIASDNRAVTAVARGAGLTPDQLVQKLNAKAKALGLRHTEFTDPTGLNGNKSTPREVSVALQAALEDEVLADILSTKAVTVRSVDEKGAAVVDYNSTNIPLRVGRHDVLGGKTGYTDEARYCLAIAAKIEGRRVAMVFLGAEGELTRFADFSRVVQWMDAGSGSGSGAEAEAEVEGNVGADVDPPPAAVTRRILDK